MNHSNTPTTIDTKGREFHIMEEVANLLDTLPPDKQRQAMAALATRYDLKLVEPAQGRGGGYRPAPRRGKTRSW